MAPPLLVDLSSIDLDDCALDATAIEAINPHRGAMRQIDTVHYISEDETLAVASKQVGDDEFWVPGHIPGRPVLPGVLMLEAAAQVASILSIRTLGEGSFLGFTGVDGAKFRGQVVPGDRLLILVKQRECRPRRFTCETQGVVAGRLVFEATVQGMPI